MFLRSRVAFLALVAACRPNAVGPAPDRPDDLERLGRVTYMSPERLDELEQAGRLYPLGELDPVAELAAREQADAEAVAVIENFLRGHPELRKELLWDDMRNALRLADGSIQVDVLGVGHPVLLQSEGLEQQSLAAVIDLLGDRDAQEGVLDAVHPIVPESCRALVAPPDRWATMTLDELIDAQDILGRCSDEWSSFVRPFGDDEVPAGDGQPQPPTETGTCAASFPILDGGGNDGTGGCAPSNPMAAGFAFAQALSPVRDQANRSTCAAFATASALEYATRRLDGSVINLSEQEIYAIGKYNMYGEHFAEGLPTAGFIGQLGGYHWRIDLENSWGYNPSPCRQTDEAHLTYLDSCVGYANDACSETAHQLGIASTGPGQPLYLWSPVEISDAQYVEIDDTITLSWLQLPESGAFMMNAAVAAGWGVVASLWVTHDFDQTGPDGFLPSTNNGYTGGHAVQVVRIVPDWQAPGLAWVVIKNSWGCGFGDGGYAYLSRKWFLSHAKAVSLIRPKHVVESTPPTVTITTPAPVTTQPLGSFGNAFNLSASVADAEEGAGCCEVTWSSTVDGPLGTGNPLPVVLHGTGERTLTATVRDVYGMVGQDTAVVTLTNQAPQPEITRPEWNPLPPWQIFGMRIPTGVGVPFSGVAPDPNGPFEVPCYHQSWTVFSADPAVHPQLFVGCTANAHLDVPGWYKVTYGARDENGAVGLDTRWVRVVEWGPKELPYIQISNPARDGLFVADPGLPMQLTAEVGSGTGMPPEVRWVVVSGGTEIELGTGTSLDWTPSDDVSSSCGGRDVELRAEATDANGTRTDDLTVHLFYPPC